MDKFSFFRVCIIWGEDGLMVLAIVNRVLIFVFIVS